MKKLLWNVRDDDGVVHSDPIGLEKSYYIYQDNDDVELVLLSNDGDYDEDEDIIYCANLDEAKSKAQSHYEEIIKQHI